MIRFGVIGAGGFADKKPIPALRESKDCQLEALMVRDLERAKKLAEKHGANKYYDSVDSLLKDKDIDAVYIATPVYMHKEYTIKAAEYGKDILCEKPMALNPAECKEMIKTCQEKRVKLMIGFMMRFHSYHQRIKELINQGTLGKIISARAQLHLWYPDTPGAWRQTPKLGGGGAIMDLGSHCIDLLCFLLGDVKEVVTIVDTIAFNYPVEDAATLLLKFKNKAQAIVDNSFAIPNRENLLEIYGTKGTILASKTIGPFTDPQMKLITERGEEKFNIPFINLYQAEFEHFAKCIKENREPSITAADGLKNMEIISAAYQSSKTKKIQRVNGGV